MTASDDIIAASDYYTISEKETAQVAYDKQRKAVTISVDYLDGVGAPDNKLVVGGELEQRPNGSLYKMVWHGFHDLLIAASVGP